MDRSPFNKPLKIIACSVFRPELTALIARGLITVPIRYVDSRFHLEPQRLQIRLEEIIAEERESGFRILLIYGNCFTRMAELTSDGDVVRVAAADCGEMLLGKERGKFFMKKGAFLLFPEWVGRWKEILARTPGMSEEDARAGIREAHTEFVYLNTGICPVPRSTLEACSEFFGLPYEVADVNLNHLQNCIREGLDLLAGPERRNTQTSYDRRATAVMMLDIVAAVLARPERIAETSAGLSRKIRELTGARMTILVVWGDEGDEKPGMRILAVSPSRHKASTEDKPVREIIDGSRRMNEAMILACPSEKNGEECRTAGMDLYPCLVIPLTSGEEQLGAILSFGLMDESFAASILEVQHVLSRIVSVVLKNALLLEKQQLLQRALEAQIEEHKYIERDREKLIVDLTKALTAVKTMSGLLPICSSCRKIRDDQGYRHQVESFLRKHPEEEFSHSICPDCAEKLNPELNK